MYHWVYEQEDELYVYVGADFAIFAGTNRLEHTLNWEVHDSKGRVISTGYMTWQSQSFTAILRYILLIASTPI